MIQSLSCTSTIIVSFELMYFAHDFQAENQTSHLFRCTLIVLVMDSLVETKHPNALNAMQEIFKSLQAEYEATGSPSLQYTTKTLNIRKLL